MLPMQLTDILKDFFRQKEVPEVEQHFRCFLQEHASRCGMAALTLLFAVLA